MINKKVECIADNFLNIFSKIDDPYLSSLQLINETDYKSFGEKKNIESDVMSERMKTISQKIEEFLKIELIDADLENKKFFDEVLETINDYCKKFDFEKIEEQNGVLAYQNIVFEHSIVLKLMHFLHLFKDKSIPSALTSLIFKVIRNSLQKNIGSQSIFFQPYYITMIDEMKDIFIGDFLDIFFEIFQLSSEILPKKESLYIFIESLFAKFVKEKDYQNTCKVIKILKYFLDQKNGLVYKYIPEYDLKIAFLLKNNFPSIGFEDLEGILKNNDISHVKYTFFMNYFDLFESSISFRFENLVFTFLNKTFPLKNLINLIEACGKNFKMRTILFGLFSKMYVDPKNLLINERYYYNTVKPTGGIYDEDPFYDTSYDVVISFILDEIRFFLSNFQEDRQNSQLSRYLSNALMTTCYKISNCFLRLKNDDIIRVCKYIEKFQELQLLLDQEFDNFFNTKQSEIESSQKVQKSQMQLEMKSGKENNVIKFKRICKSINENSLKIIDCKNLNYANRSLVKVKDSKSVLEKVKTHIKSYSNSLEDRIEGAELPITKMDKFSEKYLNNEKSVVLALSANYEKNKRKKLGADASKNVYINSFNAKSEESELQSYNFCNFVVNQIKNTVWNCRNKVYILGFVESLCNCLFITTRVSQKNLLKIFNQDKSALNKIWFEMLDVINFVRLNKFFKLFY